MPGTVIRLAVASVLCLSYPVLAYLSLSTSTELSTPIIVGYLLIVALLLREIEGVADLVNAWRGGDGGD